MYAIGLLVLVASAAALPTEFGLKENRKIPYHCDQFASKGVLVRGRLRPIYNCLSASDEEGPFFFVSEDEDVEQNKDVFIDRGTVEKLRDLKFLQTRPKRQLIGGLLGGGGSASQSTAGAASATLGGGILPFSVSGSVAGAQSTAAGGGGGIGGFYG